MRACCPQTQPIRVYILMGFHEILTFLKKAAFNGDVNATVNVTDCVTVYVTIYDTVNGDV